MVGAALGKEGFKLLPDGLDEVRFECGHGACSLRSGSVENSPNDGASVPALHHDALPIDGSSYLPGSEAMYACIHESWAGFFERVCTLSATTANLRDPPPPRRTKEPEPHCQGSGSKRITRRATVNGALAWGRGRQPPAQCPSTAHKPPRHHAACRRHAPQSIACRCAPRRNPLLEQPRSRHQLVDVVV